MKRSNLYIARMIKKYINDLNRGCYAQFFECFLKIFDKK
jgi:hypothetical protein